jgi:hypothetical protein
MSCVRIIDLIGGGIIPWPRPVPCPGGGGGGGDNTPNAVNWDDIRWIAQFDEGDITSQRITGITSSITLQIQPNGSSPTLYYQISNNDELDVVQFGFPDPPWVAVTSNTNITINNNQYLSFTAYGAGLEVTATIVNVSDNNTVLDTFTRSVYS